MATPQLRERVCLAETLRRDGPEIAGPAGSRLSSLARRSRLPGAGGDVAASKQDGNWIILGGLARLMRVRWQPEPAAQIESKPNCWTDCLPDVRILWPGGAPEGAGHLAALEAEMSPDTVRRACRFPSHQWALCVLLHYQPLVGDLVDTNPALAYGLANNQVFRGTREETTVTHALLHALQKQRDLLGWLGFPGTTAVVKLFRKLAPEDVDPYVLLRLRSALSSDGDILGMLAHHPRITGDMFDLVTHTRLRPLVTQQLLAEVASTEDREAAGRVADTLIAALSLMRRMQRREALRPFESIAAVDRFLQGVERDYLQFQAMQEQRRQLWEDAIRASTRSGGSPLPPPPLPGTETIVPLTSNLEMMEEGRHMNHCVGMMSFMVRAGDLYAYRILRPQRATLAITPAPGGHWRVFQLRGFNNAKVGRQTREAVERWLREASWRP